MPAREAFVRHVRNALGHLRDRAYLQHSPLARLASSKADEEAADLSFLLERSLRECVEDPKLWTGARAAHLHQLLVLRYVEGLSARDVQARLAASRSEYFREQQSAVEVVASRLWETLSKASNVSNVSSVSKVSIASIASIEGQLEPSERSDPNLAAVLSSSVAHSLQAPNNLPIQPTRLIGREREMAELRRLLESSRLLTLTGAGGSGKTRLALELARLALDDFGVFPDGVYFVDLSSLRDPAMVLPAVARVLGVHQIGRQSLAETIERHLRGKALLLVLDNFEHLLEAASPISDLLSTCPRLKVIVTSREPLHLRVEQEYLVPPLELPDLGHLPPLDSLVDCPAVGFFVDAVQRVRPDFALGEHNMRAVAELCVRLDGLPLALELTAARGAVLSPQAMLQRLDCRLELPGMALRDLPARQQTIRNTIDWSHALLGEVEQRLFRRLSVFVGGFSVEAAESVGRDLDSADPEAQVFGMLIGLVERNLIARWVEGESVAPVNAEPRFGLLETIREYAAEGLAASGELDLVRERHAEYFASFAERAGSGLCGSEQLAWLERVEREHANLRAALGWSLSHGRTDIALRLGGALWMFWWGHSHWSEGLSWLDQALAQSGHSSASLRAGALHSAGYLYCIRGELGRAQPLLRESVALLRETGDQTALSRSLTSLGLCAYLRGDFELSARLTDEALTLARAVGDEFGAAYALRNQAVALHYLDDPDRASALAEQGIAAAPDAIGRAFACLVLGVVDLLGLQRFEQARGLAAEALAILGKLGEKWGIVLGLLILAFVALSRGSFGLAIRLLSAVGNIGAEVQAAVPATELARMQQALAELRQEVGEDAFLTAWAEGQAMTLEEAVNVALHELGAEGSGQQPVEHAGSVARPEGHSVATPGQVPRPDGLSAREVEVLRLVALGRSNREIAAALILSVSTVDRHIANIYAKIDVHGRAEAATYALRHGLMEAV